MRVIETQRRRIEELERAARNTPPGATPARPPAPAPLPDVAQSPSGAAALQEARKALENAAEEIGRAREDARTQRLAAAEATVKVAALEGQVRTYEGGWVYVGGLVYECTRRVHNLGACLHSSPCPAATQPEPPSPASHALRSPASLSLCRGQVKADSATIAQLRAALAKAEALAKAAAKAEVAAKAEAAKAVAAAAAAAGAGAGGAPSPPPVPRTPPSPPPPPPPAAAAAPAASAAAAPPPPPGPPPPPLSPDDARTLQALLAVAAALRGIVADPQTAADMQRPLVQRGEAWVGSRVREGA